MIKEKPPSATVYQTNALGGTSKMYSYCSNNLLNIKDVFIKKLFIPIFMLKFSLKLSLHHRLVRVVAQSRNEFMTIGYRQSKIFLFRQSTVSLFFENADMSAPAAKNSMRIIPFCHAIFREQID